MIKIIDIISAIEQFAPLSLQEEYDNAGTQIGNTAQECSGAILCIDVTESIVDEAVERNCNLIVSHHPLLFKGLKSITGKNEIEKIVIKAIQNNVTIYSAHTNIDNAWNGVSHKIAKKLNVENIEVLEHQKGDLLRLVVYVPTLHSRKVRDALFAAGAGRFGNYDSCSYSLTGEGTFRALDGANPFVGNIDEIHTEAEVRQEYIIAEVQKSKIISTLIANHPYEEPAFDLIKLENCSKYTGTGVIGNVIPVEKEAFLNKIKSIFKVGAIRYSNGSKSKIARIAICGGSGAFTIPTAINHGADMIITGDVKYHDFTTFGNNIIIADIGHYESEQFTKEIFYKIIREKFPNFATYYPDKEKNPINYL